MLLAAVSVPFPFLSAKTVAICAILLMLRLFLIPAILRLRMSAYVILFG
jgi:hypothetical protein